MLTGRKANHSFDYLDDDKKKNNQCVKHLKNEREQDKIQRNRLDSNQNIFLLNRNIACSI